MRQKKYSSVANEKNEDSNTSYIANMRKTILRSSLFALLALVVIVLATFAWFSANRDVSGDGMKMQIEASPNLIIGKTAGDLTGVIANLGTKVSVSFTEPSSAVMMRPATHESSSSTCLKYNTNPGAVAFDTGFASNSTMAPLLFENVPEFSGAVGEARYYYDYTVYIASAGKELEAKSLTATLDFNGTTPNPMADHYNAASVDFYLGSVSSSNYKGTLNIAGTTPSVALMAGASASDTITIPWNQASSNNYITVVMRFYFDGALEKSTGQAYVYSDNLSPAALNLKVSFTAPEPDPPSA